MYLGSDINPLDGLLVVQSHVDPVKFNDLIIFWRENSNYKLRLFLFHFDLILARKFKLKIEDFFAKFDLILKDKLLNCYFWREFQIIEFQYEFSREKRDI